MIIITKILDVFKRIAISIIMVSFNGSTRSRHLVDGHTNTQQTDNGHTHTHQHDEGPEKQLDGELLCGELVGVLGEHALLHLAVLPLQLGPK